MLRIGDVVKQFDISHRTLRYWEDEGILNSERGENGYRYYDEANLKRLAKIVFLRKIRIPIADIENILKTSNINVALDALSRHKKNINQISHEFSDLLSITENLLAELTSNQSLEPFTSQFVDNNDIIDSELYKVLQISLSERDNKMNNKKKAPSRIVRLPKMMMACYRVESETPEMDCWNVMDEFIRKHSLHQQYGFRHFGFNNPNPSESNSVYGYEMWVSVPADIEIPAPLWKKEFEGGLYAALTTSVTAISEESIQLWEWVKDNEKYCNDTSRHWLEEFPDYKLFFENGGSDKQIELLACIKEK